MSAPEDVDLTERIEEARRQPAGADCECMTCVRSRSMNVAVATILASAKGDD